MFSAIKSISSGEKQILEIILVKIDKKSHPGGWDLQIINKVPAGLAEFAPAGANKIGSFRGGIHFCPGIPL